MPADVIVEQQEKLKDVIAAFVEVIERARVDPEMLNGGVAPEIKSVVPRIPAIKKRKRETTLQKMLSGKCKCSASVNGSCTKGSCSCRIREQECNVNCACSGREGHAQCFNVDVEMMDGYQVSVRVFRFFCDFFSLFFFLL